MKKVLIPNLNKSPDGIGRVMEAVQSLLPKHGWTAVTDGDHDAVWIHGADNLPQDTSKPILWGCHGFMWFEYFGNSRINNILRRNGRAAHAITAPSRWVSSVLARGFAKPVHTVYHGVDIDKFKPPKKHGAYVLWNKGRIDSVSNPTPVCRLADMMPDVPFVSTFGDGHHRPNMRVTGRVPYAEMVQLVQGARLYLCTTRETFGIGTLEALACGVPVVGWDYGGQSEIWRIRNGKYREAMQLVPYGDYNALADAVLSMYNNIHARQVARELAINEFGWDDKIATYAHILDQITSTTDGRVTVVITHHNLSDYVDKAIDSVLPQLEDGDDLIIVDDASTEKEKRALSDILNERDLSDKLLPLPVNVGLSTARNTALSHVHTEYVLYLDADDMLAAGAIRALRTAMNSNRHIAAGYGSLATINNDGDNWRLNEWPFKRPFNYMAQISHQNQLPYCAMIRTNALKSIGGYRRRDWRAEDAAMWIRLSSFGWNIERVTNEVTLVYRWRPDSKSQKERKNAVIRSSRPDGDWTAWYSWRYGKRSLMPIGAPVDGVPVYMVDPVLSVVIPCSEKHKDLCI
ncbi:MAG: glycosyltransferase, partial [Chloroflexi bacterium]